MRAARAGAWLESVLRDLRLGARQLRRNPGFAAVAVLTLALGIGANTALFSVVNAVLFRPLPYPNSDRLVMVFLQNPALGIERGGYGTADFLALRQQQRSFESVAAFSGHNFTLTGEHAPEAIPGTTVTAAFFDVLGVKAKLGRTFLPGEDQAGRQPVVVVSDRFWREHLGADPSAPGRTVTLDGTSFRILGVLPPNFHFGPEDSNDLWPILQFRTPTQRPPYFLLVAGRLKAGVPAATAAADASRIAANVSSQYPGANHLLAALVPMKETVVGGTRPALRVMLGAVGLVLLLAVVNVATLQLARSATRRRELAIRTALGAGQWRLIRQLLTESMLLSAVGGALGLGFAYGGLRAVIALSPGVVPRMDEIAINGPVLLYALGISLLAGIIFGMAAALRMHAPHTGAS
ncbi:MAG: ABC transporter permease, partial [Terriglobales bacterium]